jgi:TatD DNase family protein
MDLPDLVDAHAHLDQYEGEQAQVLAELETNRILTLAQSMDPDSYPVLQTLAARSPWVVPCFGVHPWRAPAWVEQLPRVAATARQALALGEVGLDHHFVQEPEHYPAQREVLECLLDVARDRDLIVNLHSTGAERLVADLLVEHRIRRAIVHWYSGPWDVLDDLLALGAYCTVGVGVLRSQHQEELAQRLPADRLLTETDNPGGWEWLTGTQGRPELLRNVIARIAELRDETPRNIIRLVHANAVSLGMPGLEGPAEHSRP